MNQCITTIMTKACNIVSELGILEAKLIDVRVQNLTSGVTDAQTELGKV